MSSDRTKQICLWMTIDIFKCIYIYIYIFIYKYICIYTYIDTCVYICILRTMTDMTLKSQSLNRVDWICMRNTVFVYNHMLFQSRCRPTYLTAYNTH